MDLYGKDRGNISLPSRLQPRDFDETKLENVIINTQKSFYDLKLSDINKKIQRLEDRNKELEDSLEDTDRYINALLEEKAQEIFNLNTQVTSQVARIDEYKKNLLMVEKSRTDDKIAHAAKVININDKYKNTKLVLTSQIKLLSAKTNVLEDYKLMQDTLRKKLDTQNKALIHERQEVEQNLQHIERKFRLDREILKKDLYNRLVDLASIFQVEVPHHMPRSIPRLLSENIAISNSLLTIMESANLAKQDCILRKKSIKEYKRKMKNAHLYTKRLLLITKVEKFVIQNLREIRRKARNTVSKLHKSVYLKEEQCIINKDNAAMEARNYETHVKHLQILLYCEKEKLSLVTEQKQWISDQLQMHVQMIYDIKHALMDLKLNNNDE